MLGRAIREEPRIFAVAVGGSVLFGAADDRQRVRRRRGGRRGRGAGDRRAARSAPARSPWPPPRCHRHQRAAGGRHLRPPARRRATCSSACRPRYRRRVTRRYLELPLSWHQPPRHRHAAVQRQLRRRGGLVPDRAAAVRGRHHGHAGRRGRRRCSPPTGRSRWSASPSSRRCSRSTSSTPAGWRRGWPGPSSCAPRSARSRTRASTARWWSRRWAGRREETDRFAARAGELRDAMIRGRPAARRCSTRCWRRCPASARSPCWWSARAGCSQGAISVDRAGQRRVPVHRAGVPGAGDRLGARRAAAQRRRLGPGAARCSTADRRHARTATRTCRPATGPRALRFDGVDFALRRRRQPVLHDVTFTCRPGGPWPWSGRPAPASRPSPSLAARLRRPGRAARSRSTASTLRELTAARAGRARSRWCRRCRSSSTTRCAATSPSTGAGVDDDGRLGGAAAGPGRRLRRRACPTASTPMVGERGTSLSGGQRQRLTLARALAGAAAAAGARRRDQRRRPAGGGGASWPRCAARDAGASILVVAYRRATIALADEVVYLEHGRVRRPRHPRASCWPPCPATPTWSPRTSRPRPSASASTPTTRTPHDVGRRSRGRP